MAILELRAAQPDDPLHFTCFLCQFVAADRAQLKKHLTTLHSFPCHDWTPARDSLEDQVTCAHCGSVHHCQQALRKHIIYGHCSQFDPARPTRNGDADIVEQLSVDALTWFWQILKWNEDWPMTANSALRSFLKFPIWWGIYVSNMVNCWRRLAVSTGSTAEICSTRLHLCATHQAIQIDPYMCSLSSTEHDTLQWQCTVQYSCGVWWCCQERMETHVPLDRFSWCMMHWRQETLSCFNKMQTFVQSWVNNVFAVGSLLHWQDRPQNMSFNTTSKPCIRNRSWPSSVTCDWCGVTIVPTDATHEYDDHVAGCPVLLHFVTWLLIPLTSPSHGSRAGGRSIPDSGCTGDAGGLGGSKRPLSEEAKKESAVGATIQEAFNRRRRRSSSKDAVPDVSTGSEARERSELPAPTEHLHPLHVHREGRAWCPRSCRPAAIGNNNSNIKQTNLFGNAWCSMWWRAWSKESPRWWTARRRTPCGGRVFKAR